MMKRFLCSVLIPFCALWAAGAFAEDPRTLTWEELSIKLSAADNPFATLSTEQLIALGDVAGLRNRKTRGVALSPDEVSIEQTAMKRLRQDGIDVDGLLAKRDEIAQKKRAAASAVNPALDGKIVRIPGYVLPLEFSGKQVTEFLLVPWVGACIHTPPPEPNQIVYVKPDKGFDINGMFDAVWVTGRIAATASTKSVHIVDGSSDIQIGYALRASKVERYQQQKTRPRKRRVLPAWKRKARASTGRIRSAVSVRPWNGGVSILPRRPNHPAAAQG